MTAHLGTWKIDWKEGYRVLNKSLSDPKLSLYMLFYISLTPLLNSYYSYFWLMRKLKFSVKYFVQYYTVSSRTSC